jgi:hypothetical protein
VQVSKFGFTLLTTAAIAVWFYIAALLIYSAPLNLLITGFVANIARKKRKTTSLQSSLLMAVFSLAGFLYLQHWLDTTRSTHFGGVHLSLYAFNALIYAFVFYIDYFIDRDK